MLLFDQSFCGRLYTRGASRYAITTKDNTHVLLTILCFILCEKRDDTNTFEPSKIYCFPIELFMMLSHKIALYVLFIVYYHYSSFSHERGR